MALILFSILSCEKDDICIEAVTPNLIIRFYDIDDSTLLKEIEIDSLWVDGMDNLYKNVKSDSILVPIDLTKDNTLFKISSNNLEDNFNFTYTRKDVFVSRSCGYKTIFEDLKLESNTSNILKEVNIINSTIDNETAAHITILH